MIGPSEIFVLPIEKTCTNGQRYQQNRKSEEDGFCTHGNYPFMQFQTISLV